MPIQPFLRTPDNYPKQEAAKAGSARFPANSIAYLVVARFVDDVLVLPSKESFTGATDTMQFVGNFSKQIPYCLAYEDRNGAKPYAMFFKPAPRERAPCSCSRPRPAPSSATAPAPKSWPKASGRRGPSAARRPSCCRSRRNVDPLDTGVSNVERESARIAFVQPTKGTPGVRPGKLYEAGAKIYDYQYRFNKTAADAVRQAIGVAAQ